jgi:hypothetical protein
MFDDDGSIPPPLRRAPQDPHWRHLDGAQVSKTNHADNSLAEGAASGRRTTSVDTDTPETTPPSTVLAVVPVNSEPVAPGAQTDLYRSAAQSWDHLKQTPRDTWGHYVIIGKAMVAARDEILRELDRNAPRGPAYQRRFRAWLAEYRLDDMDKGARARLIKLIEVLPEVEAMLSDLTDQDRRKRSHPNTIYRALKEWRLARGQPTEAHTKKPTGDSRKELLQENERLQAYIADIEAAREYETAATAINPAKPTDIVIEANRSAGIEIASSSRKPNAARRVAVRAERNRHQQLEDLVSQISCACENTEELELPTLTVAERDDAVAKLKASATCLNEFIGRLKAAPIRTERDQQHD